MFPYVMQNNKPIKYWITFLIIMSLLTILILFKKYDDEINFIGLYEMGKIKILIKEENITTLPNKVILNNKEYNYEIENVSEEYYQDNEVNYKMLTISSEFITDEKIVNIKFIRGKTRMYNQIIKIIKGGTI